MVGMLHDEMIRSLNTSKIAGSNRHPLNTPPPPPPLFMDDDAAAAAAENSELAMVVNQQHQQHPVTVLPIEAGLLNTWNLIQQEVRFIF
jgi:hypothetical protein